MRLCERPCLDMSTGSLPAATPGRLEQGAAAGLVPGHAAGPAVRHPGRQWAAAGRVSSFALTFSCVRFMFYTYMCVCVLSVCVCSLCVYACCQYMCVCVLSVCVCMYMYVQTCGAGIQPVWAAAAELSQCTGCHSNTLHIHAALVAVPRPQPPPACKNMLCNANRLGLG